MYYLTSIAIVHCSRPTEKQAYNPVDLQSSSAALRAKIPDIIIRHAVPLSTTNLVIE